ncbi:kinase-like domain-containing protein [Cubamyces lactineus]|nr:kinase-like domain-containing protein [Cubamyces lactineus]
MVEQKKLPGYIYLPPDAARRQADLTNNGVYNLITCEVPWKDRYEYLLKKRYKLRARYHPKWKPSWTGTNLDPDFCEDSVVLNNPDVIDATRQTDGQLVAIKTIKKGSQELQISRFLSSVQHDANHCVPMIDVLDDPLDPTISLMVMQYLRPWDDPELTMVGDVVDFVSQMLEGLAFLHNQRVAHRDIAPPNVMMDGRSLYPQGHHPIWRDRSPDAIEDLVPLHRMDHPVKYFYVDFGLSVRFAPGSSTLVVGDVGRDAEVPELSSTIPYDGFKADIYALGNLFDKELAQKYHGLEFLRSLIDVMKRQQPPLRPTADELVEMFQKTKKTLTPSGIRWRLGSKSEPAYERLLYDTVAVAKDGISQLRRFVRPT